MAKANDLPRISVLGSQYTLMRRTDVTRFLLNHGLNLCGGYVCVSNVHTTMMGYWNQEYRKITNQSLCSIPDGMPLVWAMRRLGAWVQDRVRGPSLMRDICHMGIGLGAKHYLFGSSPETLALLQKKLNEQYAGIQIVGAESPPFRPLTEQENLAVMGRVRASGAHFLWVGLGAPKQEIWMHQNVQATGALQIGVGAAFDLLAERISEAPAWMQNLSLEWVYRLYKEPRRLWRRYLYNNPVFVVLFLGQWLTGSILGLTNKSENCL